LERKGGKRRKVPLPEEGGSFGPSGRDAKKQEKKKGDFVVRNELKGKKEAAGKEGSKGLWERGERKKRGVPLSTPLAKGEGKGEASENGIYLGRKKMLGGREKKKRTLLCRQRREAQETFFKKNKKGQLRGRGEKQVDSRCYLEG